MALLGKNGRNMRHVAFRLGLLHHLLHRLKENTFTKFEGELLENKVREGSMNCWV